MTTHVMHEGIALYLSTHETPTQLKDGTWSHPAKIVSHTRLADLDKLKTLELWDQTVQGVEVKNAKDIQNGQTVGLILKEKKW